MRIEIIGQSSMEGTFSPQIFPTLVSSTSSSSIWAEAFMSSVTSSLRPFSFARCSRQMKQKLVLISSILSFGYDFCKSEITDVKTRGSDGSVAGWEFEVSYCTNINEFDRPEESDIAKREK